MSRHGMMSGVLLASTMLMERQEPVFYHKREPRKSSGKDRTKIKAARKQRHKRKP